MRKMKCKLNDRCLVQCKWEHVWCDPKFFGNLTFKEYIPGPFKSPQLVCTLPFLTHCKRDARCPFGSKESAEASRAKVEDLNRNISPCNQLSRSYDSMNREDVVCAHGIRKNDQFLGPGIPDPWKYFPYVEGLPVPYFGDLKTDIKKYLGELLHCKNFRSGKDNFCFCCKKRYLFECPDNSGTNLRDRNVCSCMDCHGKDNTTPEESAGTCKCVQVLQNWVLENSHLFSGKDRKDEIKNKNLISPIVSNYSEEDVAVGQVNDRKKLSMLCTCLKNRIVSKHVPVHCHDSNAMLCSCPYFKIYSFNKNDAETNTENFIWETCGLNETISREIQTECLKSDSKKENEEIKRSSYTKPRCRCSSKCLHCAAFKCKYTKGGCRSQDQVCHDSCFGNSSFLCPFSCVRHTSKKNSKEPDNPKNKEKKKKKKYKNKATITDFNSKEPSYLWSNQAQDFPKKRTTSFKKEEKSKTNSLNSNEKIYYFNPENSAFDRLRYLTNYRLENSLHRRENFNDLMNTKFYNSDTWNSPPKFRNLYDDDIPNIVAKERFKPLHYFKLSPRENQVESSCEENNHPRNFEYDRMRRFKTVQTSTTLMNDKRRNNKEVPMKIKFLKELADSDESRTYGLNRNCEGSCKDVRKRRRLLRAKRRRKKLPVKKTSTFIKQPRSPDRADKNIQVNKTLIMGHRNHNFQNPKSVSFGAFQKKGNDSKLLGLSSKNGDRDLNSSKCWLSKQYSFSKYSPSIADTIKRIEDKISKKKSYAVPNTEVLVDVKNQTDLDGILDKISYNSGTTWSTNTLKSIVDDLLGEKQTSVAIKLKGQEVQTNDGGNPSDCNLLKTDI